LIFVLLAFGPVWPAIWGQAIVKMLSSLIILPLLKGRRMRSLRLITQRG
jgi:hypothetical protein